jgi:hypothetical protein
MDEDDGPACATLEVARAETVQADDVFANHTVI